MGEDDLFCELGLLTDEFFPDPDQIGMALSAPHYDLMEVLADAGTLLICIDLAAFLFSSKAPQGASLEEYARQLEQPPSKLIYVTRKLGHLGIMLILVSWIVPLLHA